MRDEIATSETAESRHNRLQSEAQRKQASRAQWKQASHVGSPSRSSSGSESDVVMGDVIDSSSSDDESSDEPMDNDVQMTGDAAKLPGMLTDKLEVDEKVQLALEQLILRTLNDDLVHHITYLEDYILDLVFRQTVGLGIPFALLRLLLPVPAKIAPIFAVKH